jgi:aminoglycoside phosphotransferase (APT) family kinase protein
MEELKGGRNGIMRRENRIHRPAGPWTPLIHRLLQHLRNEGFSGAPEPHGFDEEGREILSHLPGEVSNYPLSDNARSLAALASAARLLRAYHQASQGFLQDRWPAKPWQLPPREPAEVICHGDFAPYNVVLDGTRAIGIIDFDTAHPGPRSWDLAYALYRWAPFTNPNNHDGFGALGAQIERGRLFCDAYGLPHAERAGLAAAIAERLRALVAFMFEQSQQGSADFSKNMEDGHHLLYIADVAYVEAHQAAIDAGLGATSR